MNRLKTITSILFLVNVFLLTAQEKITWDFPVKPGTEKWNNLKTEKARINAMQIPEEVLYEMKAKDLIDACINFPLFGYYSAFNTPQEGFKIMFSRFNIFNKLCEMDNIGQYLIKVYEDAEMNGWRHMGYKLNEEYWTLRFNYFEYLISQNEIIATLDQKEKAELIQIAKTKMAQKSTNGSFNSVSGISSSLLLMSRILHSDKSLFNSSLSTPENIQHFLETGMLNNPEMVDEILSSTELYLIQ